MAKAKGLLAVYSMKKEQFEADLKAIIYSGAIEVMGNIIENIYEHSPDKAAVMKSFASFKAKQEESSQAKIGKLLDKIEFDD